MGFGLLDAIIPGAGFLGGLLSNTEASRTTKTTPSVTPGYQSLADLLRARAMSRLNTGTDLGGFTAGGVNNINTAFNNAAIGTNANLTARGLATSPVAAAVAAKANTARAGDIASFMNTIPLLQRQLQDQDMASGLALTNDLGKVTTTVGPGSPLAGGFTSAAELLAYMKGKQGIGAPAGGNV